MSPFTKEDTQAWWLRTLSDPAAVNAWLQKLYQTELSGYTDHLQALALQGDVEPRTAKILLNIAEDELRHSRIILVLMKERGIEKGTPAFSEYWKTVNAAVTNLDQYCAVNHYGEDLAAFRFEVIRDMGQTPADIRQAIDAILPDEQFHRTTLKLIAGQQALDEMAVVNERAIANLRGS